MVVALTVEQQPSAAAASSDILLSTSTSNGCFSLFQHHRRPPSSTFSISRIQKYIKQEGEAYHVLIEPSAKNLSPWEQRIASTKDKRLENPPPWQQNSYDEARVNDASGKNHIFRPSPWHQGSRKNLGLHPNDAALQEACLDAYAQEKVDSKPAQLTNAEADKLAMARIVEELQKTLDLADTIVTGRTVLEDSDDSFMIGQRVNVEHASIPPIVLYKSGAQAETGKRITRDRSYGGRTFLKESKRAPTESSPYQRDARASPNGKLSSTQAEILVSDTEIEAAKFPWERDEKVHQEEKLIQREARGPSIPSLAELTLSAEELQRLRVLGSQLPEMVTIGKLGVTNRIVTSILQQFTTSELVKVRCEGAAAATLKKTHLKIEEKTGGLVVLRSGKIMVVYRGHGDIAPQNGTVNTSEGMVENLTSRERRPDIRIEMALPDSHDDDEGLVDRGDTHNGSEPAFYATNATMASYLRAKRETDLEAESILEGLGPRFETWTSSLPIPIDADLLPPVVLNYRAPFRLMPHGVRPRLNNVELADLRRQARPLAPHFVLGRNKGHQGLAVAIVKLWEKSEIAKVAVKKGVDNVHSSMMADELKGLTGGVVLSRDRFFITFYRGRDFVPEKVASALVEREVSVRELQELEEKARNDRSIPVKRASTTRPSMAVIGHEAPVVKPSWVDTVDIKEQNRLKKEVAKLQRVTLAQRMEKKLDIALRKKEKAEQDLRKLEAFLKPLDRPVDVETITEEERFTFTKIGLRMQAHLLIGVRGVFAGVVENMHLHWKHRELVKVLVKELDEAEVQEAARMLEYESGGILVAVIRTKKGRGIILYRGKNYQRPMELRPRNLLTKRKALKRSLELERHKNLFKNIKALEDQILSIQTQLRKMNEAEIQGDEGGPEKSHHGVPFWKAPDLILGEAVR